MPTGHLAYLLSCPAKRSRHRSPTQHQGIHLSLSKTWPFRHSETPHLALEKEIRISLGLFSENLHYWKMKCVGVCSDTWLRYEATTEETIKKVFERKKNMFFPYIWRSSIHLWPLEGLFTRWTEQWMERKHQSSDAVIQPWTNLRRVFQVLAIQQKKQPSNSCPELCGLKHSTWDRVMHSCVNACLYIFMSTWRAVLLMGAIIPLYIE